jgi:RNA polymerase sigma factor (sigma-70 family)
MRWSACDDATLLSATRRDGDAFAEFYDRYETAVVGFMVRRTGDTEAAVDLASEVFAAALAAAHRYRPERSSAAAWLFTIARNVLLNALRHGRVEARARERIGIRDAVEYTLDDLERIEAAVSRSDWAARLLAALPEEQRDAVTARIIDERSYPDIAQHSRTSELVVRKRVSRGLAALRSHLEDSP